MPTEQDKPKEAPNSRETKTYTLPDPQIAIRALDRARKQHQDEKKAQEAKAKQQKSVGCKNTRLKRLEGFIREYLNPITLR